MGNKIDDDSRNYDGEKENEKERRGKRGRARQTGKTPRRVSPHSFYKNHQRGTRSRY